ncbi:YbaB/EbfC family nucleoid-associated protein [Actinoplanes sp. NPDC049596]|uniref:YbaB/EbfC family nucleoid-associated protein n=1 Tax=unclassified Actinoplanes TaxID=2626549 RepID=UPI0034360AA0
MTAPDYRQMAEQVRRLTADTQRARADFERAEVTGYSPDGTIRVVMRAGRVHSLDVGPDAMNHDNVHLASQILTAIRQAEEQSAELLAARAAPVADAVDRMRGLFG